MAAPYLGLLLPLSRALTNLAFLLLMTDLPLTYLSRAPPTFYIVVGLTATVILYLLLINFSPWPILVGLSGPDP
jgi:hypothetical protein